MSVKDIINAALIKFYTKLNKKVLTTLEEIEANTDPSNFAGATAVSELSNNLTESLTAENSQPFKFGYDSATGKYGYWVKEADTEVFVPFSSKEIYFPTMSLFTSNGLMYDIVLDVQGCSQITINEISLSSSSNGNAGSLYEKLSINYNTLSDITFTEIANFDWKSMSASAWSDLSYNLPNDVYQIKLTYGGYFRPYVITDLTIK